MVILTLQPSAPIQACQVDTCFILDKSSACTQKDHCWWDYCGNCSTEDNCYEDCTG